MATDREIEIFDQAYRLGFRAGQLDRRRYSLAMLRQAEGEIAGHNIAVTRGNISLEEYTQVVESMQEKEKD